MTLMPLGDVAEITSGFTIRDRADLLASGPLRVIQLRSFDGPTLNLHDVDYLAHASAARRNVLSPGNLVVRSRGRFAVGLYRENDMHTVAGAPLLVIRLLDERLMPEYVEWFLNETPQSRAHFGRSWQGSSAPAITIADLRKIELPIPPMETQRDIAIASALIRRQHHLERQLADKRRQYQNRLLADLAAGHSREP
jgi:hypothetical protein